MKRATSLLDLYTAYQRGEYTKDEFLLEFERMQRDQIWLAAIAFLSPFAVLALIVLALFLFGY